MQTRMSLTITCKMMINMLLPTVDGAAVNNASGMCLVIGSVSMGLIKVLHNVGFLYLYMEALV